MQTAETLKKDLNPAQWEAVSHGEGPLLVIAGAGTGKTRTLTYRVAYLVQKGIPPEAILLLTFTRKAAQEMLRRAALLLDARCEQIIGGTFHHFALLMLRKFSRMASLPASFTILDRGDAEEIIGLLRNEQNLDRKELRFPRKQTILEMFSKSVNKCVPLKDVLRSYFPHFMHFEKELVFLFRRYQEYKARHAFLDYDDLLLYFNHILQERKGLAERISQSYRYLLVDEYQDTNKLQAEILRHLCLTHENLMVVGDDAQGIYSFRGANPQNIFDFPQLFPKAKIVRLEQNYRSTQPILDVANAVMQGAKQKMEKKLFNPSKPKGPPGMLIQAANERRQSEFVATKILELREEGIELQDIAVLFRSSFHSFDLEVELNKRNIPFIKFGGLKFIETAHIKDVICHLRLVLNPKDSLSLHRCLLLLEGVGPAYVRKAIEMMQQGGKLKDLPETGRSGESIQKLKQFFALADPRFPVADLLELTLDYYAPICKRKYDDYPKRLKDVEHLVHMAGSYERLDQFLAELALEPPEASQVGLLPADREKERLTLSTIHSAKGLEWHTVFIIWALDGKFPSAYAVLDETDLEEERRLMYVAITRAKERLYILYPSEIYDRTAGRILSMPSRFLEGEPEKNLQRMFYYPPLPSRL